MVWLCSSWDISIERVINHPNSRKSRKVFLLLGIEINNTLLYNGSFTYISICSGVLDSSSSRKCFS